MTVSLQHRRRMLSTVASVVAAAALPVARAQPHPWPSRPLRLIVGYPAGGTQDVLARLVAAGMAEDLGQPVVVDNRPGANSNLGAELTARAQADGYTMFVYSTATAVNASLYPKLAYDPLNDFAFIGLFAKVPNVLVVNPKLPIMNVADYVRFAKETKEGVTFASSGNGSSIHLSGEMFKMQAHLNMLHIPYRGSAPALADLISGQVHSMFNGATSTVSLVQSGKLRAIAVTSAQRLPMLPDVPTLAESGFPGFDVTGWNGLVTAAGTPRPVITRLHAALNKTLATSSIKDRFADVASVPAPGTTNAMRELAAAEIDRWREVVKASGAKPE